MKLASIKVFFSNAIATNCIARHFEGEFVLYLCGDSLWTQTPEAQPPKVAFPSGPRIEGMGRYLPNVVITSLNQKNNKKKPNACHFCARNSRARDGCAKFVGAWHFLLFLQENLHAHEVPCFRGGI